MSVHDGAGLQEVEVDQRALVNILSRYPGTFDVLRELIQNADDAEAPIVEVHFETGGAEKFQPAGEHNDISKLRVRKWIIKNKGSFKGKDWERLGRIAAGNDDSTKVGAFGVGFYSVLSKSDRPLVKSDGKSLQFCRGQDGKLCKQSSCCLPDSWTSVELELRIPERLPILADLTRFLVSSVALLTNIHTVSVFLDCQRLLHVQKESCGLPVDVTIASHLMQSTPSRVLAVESIQRAVQRIKIDTAGWAFAPHPTPSLPLVEAADALVGRSGGSLECYSAPTLSVEAILQENTITHDLYTAIICVDLHPDSEMKKGVESSMKSLPISFRCKAIYFNPEQYDPLTHINNSHIPTAKHLSRLLFGPEGIVPESSGRFFIGQSTNETTGIGLHISAHFLPTMERGSIDLANGQVAAWNKEVLWISGLLARIVYEEEMRVAASSTDEVATQLGLRTMARFAFDSSVLHSGVSRILQDAFFSCCHELKSPFPVVSNVGIMCASHSQFRQSNEDLSFLKKYRILHSEVEPRQRSEIIKRYKIPLFKYGDIVREFETGVTQDVMKSFFVWWEDTKKKSLSFPAKAAGKKFCKEFASRAVLYSNHGVEIALKNIKHFTFFPLPGDLSPTDSIYIDVASGVPTRDAIECFGWSQLSLLDWLKYARALAQQLALNGDPNVGRRISRVLVQFALVEDLAQKHAQWSQVADLIKDIECIPTNMGLRLPSDSYFDEADICLNLPVVKEDDFMDIPGTYVADAGGVRYRTVSPEHVRIVLAILRVRSTMEWKDIVERLEATASEESNDRLLQFLVTYKEKLTTQHINDLRDKRVFYSKNHGRRSAIELHFPSEDLLKLGLPILGLPGNYIAFLQSIVDARPGSFAVEPFVESLGVQRYPSLGKIIEQAASNERGVQQSALRYLLSNLETRYSAYKPDNFAHVAFIPTECGLLARPNEVFSSPVWKELGFKQASEALRRDLSRLGIKDDPSIDTIIEHLKTPERTLPDLDAAAVWFGHLSQYGRLPILKLREQFSTIPFVPVECPPSSSDPSRIEYFPPKECFIVSDDSDDTKKHYRHIFPFVNFGKSGNSFLESCCAKKSPDASDIVRKIVQDPQRYLKALGNDTNLYLEDLRMIASRFDTLHEDDKKAMQGTPMFLASWKNVDGELLPAHKVVIGDWESRDFGSSVFLAPKDDTIEKMYHKMGSEFLGTYVRYDIEPSGPDSNYNLPFNHGQVIRRIRCFMRQRDTSEKTEILFYNEGSTDNFQVRACKTLSMKKTFAPPSGVLVDGVNARVRETTPAQVKAGFEFGELYTLWVVKGLTNESVDLRNDVAVALCRVLLKTFGPNDVLLLASLIAMGDESLEGYYSTEMKSVLPSAPATKEKSKKVKVEFPVSSHLARLVGMLSPKHLRFSSQKTIHPEQDMEKAIASWGQLDSNGQPPDFSTPCQSNSPRSKKHTSHCKQAHTITLEKKEVQDEKTHIKFYLAKDAVCRQPPQPALRKFAQLISDLALVFDREASQACYIFWKDTDEDLMAFNRDQKYIFFNLAHYYKFFYSENVEEKKTATEWFLIMAHEIAHNVTLDHDEYHGSLSSRLAVTYLPKLHQSFTCFAGNARSR